MSRSRAIETRLEKLIPSLDEYFTSGFLTRAESQEVARQRTHWEYRLVAKPLLILDVRNAVEYELALEERLRQHCIKTKLQLTHRWAVLERIESIYQIGLKHLRDPNEKEALRREYVLFLKQYSRHTSLSKAYAAWLMQFPTRSDIWVEALLWEGVEQRKIDDARAMAQQALLTMSSSPDIWACVLRLELHFAERLLDGLVADERDERTKSEAAAAEKGTDKLSGLATAENMAAKMRAENAAMGSILLDLALAKTVVEEALSSVCSSPALVERLLTVAGGYAFARPVTTHIASLAMTRMVETAMNPVEDRHGRKVSAVQGRSAGAVATPTGSVAAQRARTAWLSSTPVTTTSASTSSTAPARPLAGGVDLLCRCYLALPTLPFNYERHEDSHTAVQDPVSYMACSLDGAAGRLHWMRTPHDREEAVLNALMAVLNFFFYVPLYIEEGKHITVEARARAQAVHQLLDHLVPASASSAASTAAAACVHRVVRDLLDQLTSEQRAGVSALCRRLLSLSTNRSVEAWPSLRNLALTLAHYCLADEVKTTVDESASDADKKSPTSPRKGKKAAKKQRDAAAASSLGVTEDEANTPALAALVESAKARVQTVLTCVGANAEASAPPRGRTRHEDTTKDTNDMLDAVQRWPIALLSSLLTDADRDALMTSPPSASTKAAKATVAAAAAQRADGEPLTAEAIDRLMTWWRARVPSNPKPSTSTQSGPNQADEDGKDGGAHTSPSTVVVTDAAHMLEARRQCRERAALLVQPYLPQGKRTHTHEAKKNNTVDVLCALRARAQPFVAVEAPTWGATAGASSLPSYSGATEAPLNLWRVFAALEALDGTEMALTSASASALGSLSSSSSARLASAQHPSARARRAADSDSTSSSSSDDDEDEGVGSKGGSRPARRGPSSLLYGSYAMAGIAFLATASSGALSRAGEWERVQGIHALLRCRLESLTGHRAALLRCDELVALMRESALPAASSNHGKASASPIASGVDGLWLPAWMQDLLMTVRHAQQRCQPLSRLSLSGFIIPVYEAIADACVHHALHFLRPRGIDARQAALHWLAEARSAHEQRLTLYRVSRHVESFVPLLFDGKQTVQAAQGDRVASANTADWLAYVRFEREVANDLPKAAAVAERARREALNAQEVLVKLMSL